MNIVHVDNVINQDIRKNFVLTSAGINLIGRD